MNTDGAIILESDKIRIRRVRSTRQIETRGWDEKLDILQTSKPKHEYICFNNKKQIILILCRPYKARDRRARSIDREDIN
jgi:hypothetical protein